jgi:CrcB protein
MVPTLLIFLGAGVGGVMRHGVNVACARAFGAGFPWGTLTVNVVGSFLMGALAAYFALRAGEGWNQHLRLLLTTGVLGGFTTFSAFSLDAVLLWERGAAGLAIAYVTGSVLASIAALVLGLAVVRAMT